jgi:hypothetical protein
MRPIRPSLAYLASQFVLQGAADMGLTMKLLAIRIDRLAARLEALESAQDHARPAPLPGLPAPPGGLPLPIGFDHDPRVGYLMLTAAMDAAGLTAVGVQRHGDQILAALTRRYPTLDVYLSRTDSPIWPGFGSLDVTVDSGLGGWSFRPDGYFPWVPKGQR